MRSNALDDFGRRVHGTRDDFVMGVAVMHTPAAEEDVMRWIVRRVA